MKLLKITLNGLMLLLANLTGVFIGFIVYHFMKPANQIAIQIPVAIILSVVLFAMWTIFLKMFPRKIFQLHTASDFIGVFAAALVWNPLIFVPFHYFTQGYLTAGGNIIALILFQLPVNAVVLVVAAIWENRGIFTN